MYGVCTWLWRTTNRRDDECLVVYLSVVESCDCEQAHISSLAAAAAADAAHRAGTSATCYQHGAASSNIIIIIIITSQWLHAPFSGCKLCRVITPLHLVTITAKELCFTRRLSVCLFACLLATSRKNYWSEMFIKILPKVYIWTRKTPLNFGSYPPLDARVDIERSLGDSARVITSWRLSRQPSLHNEDTLIW